MARFALSAAALVASFLSVSHHAAAQEAAADPQAIIARPITVRQKIAVTPRAGGCAEDLTDDGTVNGADLALVLGLWGACSGSCAADLNGDGAVDGNDLAALLARWGDC